MSDQLAHIKVPPKNQPGHFRLQDEIGGIAAEQVFFMHADGGQIQMSRHACRVSANSMSFPPPRCHVNACRTT